MSRSSTYGEMEKRVQPCAQLDAPKRRLNEIHACSSNWRRTVAITVSNENAAEDGQRAGQPARPDPAVEIDLGVGPMDGTRSRRLDEDGGLAACAPVRAQAWMTLLPAMQTPLGVPSRGPASSSRARATPEPVSSLPTVLATTRAAAA
jgi:hypothetical protein